MPSEWLGLAETAALLGVHPSTVRNWADRGRLPVHRTGGGHRRFRRTDLELWLQSQQNNGSSQESLVIQNALRYTRFHIQEGHLDKEEWYRKIDQRGRENYSLGGRKLLNGLKTFLSCDDETAHAEASCIGQDYAFWGYRQGLSSVDATRAFLFFRRLLVGSILTVYEDATINSPQAWGEMFQKIIDFTDIVLSTLLDKYEEYQQRDMKSHTGEKSTSA